MHVLLLDGVYTADGKKIKNKSWSLMLSRVFKIDVSADLLKVVNYEGPDLPIPDWIESIRQAENLLDGVQAFDGQL